MNLSPVELLVFQPTPFCNLNCSYCYLSQRADRRTMAVDVVRTTLDRLLHENLLSPEVGVVWHAGEPLVVKREVYAAYFRSIKKVAGSAVEVRHFIQTNATLIDDDWCDFFREHNVRIGVSIDGPADIHDRARQTRAGGGSFARTLRGIEALRANGLSFHTISVVTSASLECPEQIYSFLKSLDPDYVAFNVEEQEGVNSTSSLHGKEKSVESFFRTIYQRAKANDFSPPIREFESAWRSIQSGQGSRQNCQLWPYRMFVVGVTGDFTTFSPELLGMDSPTYGSLCLGNVLTDSPRTVAGKEKLLHLFQDIHVGVKRCEDTCEYFELCGGGAPSNKLFETGTFASAATRFCANSIQLPLRIVLEDVELTLARNQTLLEQVPRPVKVRVDVGAPVSHADPGGPFGHRPD